MPLAILALVSACTSAPAPSTTAPSTAAAMTSTTIVPTPLPTTPTPPTPPTPPTRMANWFDLDVGDCLTDPPPTDPNVIEVPLVDCAAAHRAEVYLRAPMAVNTALSDVGDRDCGAGFVVYTGQQVANSPYTVTYLIDSNQNRTASNPNPSAVICLLQSADGTPLTGSARR